MLVLPTSKTATQPTMPQAPFHCRSAPAPSRERHFLPETRLAPFGDIFCTFGAMSKGRVGGIRRREGGSCAAISRRSCLSRHQCARFVRASAALAATKGRAFFAAFPPDRGNRPHTKHRPGRVGLKQVQRETFKQQHHVFSRPRQTQTPMAGQGGRSHAPHRGPREAWARPHRDRSSHFKRRPEGRRPFSVRAARAGAGPDEAQRKCAWTPDVGARHGAAEAQG